MKDNSALFEKIYGVFGKETPNRIIYNATVASPTSTGTVLKSFKNWSDFEKAYTIFCVQKNNESKPKVITKPAATKVVKKDV